MNDSTNIMIVTAVIGLIILLVLQFVFSRVKGSNSTKRDIILFVGPRGGGKTAMTRQLSFDVFPQTVTSCQPSEIECEKYKTTFVDFPGHPKLRSGLVDFIPRALKVVFVIDASSVQSQSRDAAEILYDLFTNMEIDSCSKLIVACNKSDVPGARPNARVKLALQQELEKIKKTRISLDDGDDANIIRLGREDKQFSFDHDSPIEVNFVDCSVKSGDLNSVVDLLEL